MAAGDSELRAAGTREDARSFTVHPIPLPRRQPADPGMKQDPGWSSDGKRVAFGVSQQGKQDIYVKTVGATQEELLFISPETKLVEDWSRKQ
jgi:Tol biopolymer transport system component